VTTETETRTLYVIMGNDFPAGVMDDEAAAERLCADRNALNDDRRNRRQLSIYWRVYPYTLNQVETI
jgi:hypothetical protein